ncbi:hypothetical protein AB0J82_11460 [Asanoa sp. NPDC049518]
MNGWVVYLWPVLVLVVCVCLWLAVATYVSSRRKGKPPSKRRPWRP